MTTSALKIVGWNTAATFGVALTSSSVTLALNQLGHYSLDVPQDIKQISSAAIRFFAFIAGTAAGFYVFQKATVFPMDFDSNFISAHALPVIASLYCTAMAYLVSIGTDKSSSIIHAGLAGLLISIPCTARFGALALLPAVGIGAAVGSYL